MKRALILAAALAAPTAPPTAGQVSWREVSLPVPGEILSTEVVELAPGRRELVMATWNRELRRRELRLHPIDARGVATEPRLVLNVLDDIVAWGVAELEPENPGSELLLLTPGAVWSYVPEPGGYAQNARKLFDFDMLYDMPDRDSLPRWDYVVPGARSDQLLLPSGSGFSSFVRQAGADGPEWVESGAFDVALSPDSNQEDEIRIGPEGVEVRGGPATRVDLGRPISSLIPLLMSSRTMRAPGLADVDGDGRLDLLQRRGGRLLIHRHSPGGFRAQPDSEQKLPESLRQPDVDRDLLLRDVDADGDADLLALLEEESDGILGGNSTLSVLVFLNDGSATLRAKPDQVLRFEGVRIDASLLDVDDDGVLDLLVDTFSAPDLAELTSPDQIEATLRMMVFRGRGKGRFEREPLFRYEQSYDTDSIEDAVLQRSLEADCTGDGIPDLVTADVSGRINIRPVELESSFFGGDSWKVAATPIVRHETATVPRGLSVEDLNGDGVADLLSVHQDRVTLFLTERRR